jgi:regulator of sirC expression with transglutaminase-like and TPR domain
VDADEASERFGALLERPEPEIPLDEAALLIAAHAYPDLDVAHEMGRIDRLAEGCRTPTLDGLVRHLFVDERFGGDHDDYYDPRNSYLNDVVDRHVGIPISLSVLTLVVGRRLGVPLAGVGMPGHFLLRDRVDPTVFLDPFSRGALLDERGCEAAFRAINGPDAPFDPAYLEPVGFHTILARMLGNLKGIFAQRGDAAGLVWSVALRCRLPGMPVGEFGVWAEALVAQGRFGDAAAVLESVLHRVEPEKAERWARTAANLRARLN